MQSKAKTKTAAQKQKKTPQLISLKNNFLWFNYGEASERDQNTLSQKITNGHSRFSVKNNIVATRVE